MMKVSQGGGPNYVTLEREIWKPIHQELLKQGKITGWYLYRVQYTGTGDEFNYAVVTQYNGSDGLEGMNYGEIIQKVHPSIPVNLIFEQTMNSRDLVSTRLLQWVLQAFPEQQGEPARYAVVNYQRAMPGTNYFDLRRDFVKPVFDLAIKEGKIAGWGLWTTVFPSGTEIPYNWVSADFYNNMSEIGQYGWQDLLERANPGANIEEIMPKLGSSRSMVKNELWRLIDYVR
jgi:hypothetical protein